MHTFDGLRLTEGVPIYVQLLRYLRQEIAGGAIRDGEELPSRRAASALLGINPNTVQKVYRILEEEGLIRSHAGAKSVVTADESVRARVREELLRTDALAIISAMKQAGIEMEAALARLEALWEEGEG